MQSEKCNAFYAKSNNCLKFRTYYGMIGSKKKIFLLLTTQSAQFLVYFHTNYTISMIYYLSSNCFSFSISSLARRIWASRTTRMSFTWKVIGAASGARSMRTLSIPVSRF